MDANLDGLICLEPELVLPLLLAAAMSTELDEITTAAGWSRLEQRSGDSSDLVRLRLNVIGDGSASAVDDPEDEMRDESMLATRLAVVVLIMA